MNEVGLTSVAVRVWDSRVRLKKQRLAVEWMPIAFRCTQQVNTGTLANTLGPANPRERPFNTLSDESLNPAEPSKSLFQKRCKRGNGDAKQHPQTLQETMKYKTRPSTLSPEPKTMNPQTPKPKKLGLQPPLRIEQPGSLVDQVFVQETSFVLKLTY